MGEIHIPEEIRNKKMLVVEGKDDIGFFATILCKLNISGVYVTCIEGKNRFEDRLPDLKKRPGFSNLTHLGVIRDKDTDCAFESIANILRNKMGFLNIPSQNGQFMAGNPRIGIFIMPGDSVDGKSIEDLCLKMVERHPAMKCVNEFATCIKGLKEKPKNMSKAKVQSFLACQPEIVNSLGRGAEEGCWNFNSPALDELNSFLNNFL